MSSLRSPASAFRGLVEFFIVTQLTIICLAQAGTYVAIQEVRVSGLPVLVARSHQPTDVLLTSLTTIVHDQSVCCGRDSALTDDAERADPLSLKDVAKRLQGRHLLSDGRPIIVTAEYFDPATVNANILINTLHDQHAMLFEWNSHMYLCHGVTYRRDYDPDTGAVLNSILKFHLLDTRYSDSRQIKIFDRGTDDWSKVQGVMRLTVKPE